MTKRIENPKTYTHICSNPNCSKMFTDNSPHTKWCKDIACQRYSAALHSRNKFHRDHGQNLCKGGCGRYVFKAWCGSPECKAKQQAAYDAKRHKQPSHQKTVHLVDPHERKHDRKCRECGKPCWPNYFKCKQCSRPSYADEDWLEKGYGI